MQFRWFSQQKFSWHLQGDYNEYTTNAFVDGRILCTPAETYGGLVRISVPDIREVFASVEASSGFGTFFSSRDT